MKAKSVLNKELLQAWRRERAVLHVEVRGASMLPLIPREAKLTIESVAPERVRVGDIIVFLHDQGLVAHRVIKILRKKGKIYFLEKGDNALSAHRIPASDLIGVVKEINGEGAHYRFEGAWKRGSNALIGNFGFCLHVLHKQGKTMKKKLMGNHPLPFLSPMAEKTLYLLSRGLPRILRR